MYNYTISYLRRISPLVLIYCQLIFYYLIDGLMIRGGKRLAVIVSPLREKNNCLSIGLDRLMTLSWGIRYPSPLWSVTPLGLVAFGVKPGSARSTCFAPPL